MKKILIGFCLTMLATTPVHAEILAGQRIVGHYDCGTDMCTFETPDAGSFEFEVANSKVANKIFKLCKVDDLCAITGSFDITKATIIKVTKVENSGTKFK